MKSIFILYILILSAFCSNTVYAFSCTSNGISIGGTGTYTIPVDVTISKTTTDILLTDLSTYTSCSGYLGWAGQGGPAANDALRTYGSSSFSSAFSSIGFTGYAILPSGRFNFPLPTGKCVWPDGSCTYTSGTNLTTSPINIKIGMIRTTPGITTGTTIPAGTEIARFTLEQRGTVGGASPTWGNGIKTWIFTLKNALVVPSYTCSWTNANQTVTLSPVLSDELKRNGTGVYPGGQDFNLKINCDPGTTVSVQFDGITMKNKDNVLAKNGNENDSVGIQMQYNNTPVIIGTKMQVINNAQSQELIPLKAYYYYNGGSLTSGSLNAVTTVTFQYN